MGLTLPFIGAQNITPGTNQQTIKRGIHNGAGTVQGDPNLVPANILNGVSIFGVTGTVSTSAATGNAQPADVLSGYTFSNSSGSQTGTMPDKVGSATVITPGTTDQAIPQGYFGGATADGKVKGDANLIAANILSGKSIFGVAGSVIAGKASASGSGTTDSTGHLIVSGLSFQPAYIIVYDATNNLYMKTYVGSLNATNLPSAYNIDLNGGTYIYGNNVWTITANGFNTGQLYQNASTTLANYSMSWIAWGA